MHHSLGKIDWGLVISSLLTQSKDFLLYPYVLFLFALLMVTGSEFQRQDSSVWSVFGEAVSTIFAMIFVLGSAKPALFGDMMILFPLFFFFVVYWDGSSYFKDLKAARAGLEDQSVGGVIFTFFMTDACHKGEFL